MSLVLWIVATVLAVAFAGSGHQLRPGLGTGLQRDRHAHRPSLRRACGRPRWWNRHLQRYRRQRSIEIETGLDVFQRRGERSNELVRQRLKK
jgi:hypothetical protein